jgi:hypothetical protein
MIRMGQNVQLAAPAGRFRVVGVDLFSHEDYVVGDYEHQEDAFEVADAHNIKRGNEAVGQRIEP